MNRQDGVSATLKMEMKNKLEELFLKIEKLAFATSIHVSNQANGNDQPLQDNDLQI